MLVFVRRLRFLRALQSRPFAFLWLGQTISALGDGAYLTALAWFILQLTGSATAMGIVVTASALPRVLFLLLGGVIADRLPRRLLMLWSDTSRGLIVLLITLLAWAHLLQLWHLIVLSLLFGVVDGFFIPASQSITPLLVPAEELASANALNELSLRLSQLLGPLIGAVCVALVGPASAFGLDGLTFLISSMSLLGMRSSGPLAPRPVVVETPTLLAAEKDAAILHAADEGTMSFFLAAGKSMRGVFDDLGEGLHYVMSSSWLWVSIVISSLGNLFSAPQVVVLPKLVHDVYGAGVWLLGLLGSASACGSILGVLIVGQRKRIRRRGVKVYVGVICSGAAMMIMGIPLPRVSEPIVALVACVIIGFSSGFFNVIWFIILQQMIPGDKLGRVSSIDMMGSLCLMPVGYALGGILADHLGPQLVLLVCGLIGMLLPLPGLAVRGVRQLD